MKTTVVYRKDLVVTVQEFESQLEADMFVKDFLLANQGNEDSGIDIIIDYNGVQFIDSVIDFIGD